MARDWSVTPFPSSQGWFSTNFNQRIWAGDMNGNGRDDIVAVADNGQVHFSLSNGDGTYTHRRISSGVHFPVSQGWFSTEFRNRVFTADVTGNGYVDIVGISNDGEAFVFRNRGDGSNSFLPLRRSNVNFPNSAGWFSRNYAQRVWMADINGDGRDDIVAIDYTGRVHFALSNGDGTFGVRRIASTGTNFSNAHGWFNATSRNRVFPADVTGNGFVDFVGISGDGEAFVFRNRGDGSNSFQPLLRSDVDFRTSADWFSTAHNQRIWMADVNGNGRDDIVAIANDGSVHYALSNGNGTFGRRRISTGTLFTTVNGWFSTAYRERVWPSLVNNNRRTDFTGIAGNGQVRVAIR